MRCDSCMQADRVALATAAARGLRSLPLASLRTNHLRHGMPGTCAETEMLGLPSSPAVSAECGTPALGARTVLGQMDRQVCFSLSSRWFTAHLPRGVEQRGNERRNESSCRGTGEG